MLGKSHGKGKGYGNRSGVKQKRMNGEGGTSYNGTNYHAGGKMKKTMSKRK